jgi:predicted transcriptional regulator
MAFTLEYLLPAEQQLRTVQPHESVNYAIDIMCQHGYGQLPVTGTNRDLLGQVITFGSVIQAVQSFQTKPETLLVRDAAQPVRS